MGLVLSRRREWSSPESSHSTMQIKMLTTINIIYILANSNAITLHTQYSINEPLTHNIQHKYQPKMKPHGYLHNDDHRIQQHNCWFYLTAANTCHTFESSLLPNKPGHKHHTNYFTSSKWTNWGKNNCNKIMQIPNAFQPLGSLKI